MIDNIVGRVNRQLFAKFNFKGDNMSMFFVFFLQFVFGDPTRPKNSAIAGSYLSNLAWRHPENDMGEQKQYKFECELSITAAKIAFMLSMCTKPVCSPIYVAF